MTQNVICDVFAVTALLMAFWPISQRAGRQARLFMAGWGFLVVHYAALLAGHAADRSAAGGTVRLAALAGAALCALCFSRGPAERLLGALTNEFFLEAGVAVLLESAVIAFGVKSTPIEYAAACLFALPGIHLLSRSRSNWGAAVALSAGFGVVGVFCLPFVAGDPSMVAAAMLCVLFVVAAGFTQAARHPGKGGGVALMTAGMAGWGLSYLVALWVPMGGTGGILLAELPQYVVGYGMIVLLLQRHLLQMEELALVDSLTGLPNTRHFESRFEHVSALSAQHGNPIACLVIDVDRFKQINDTLGHAVGDELLKALAVRLAWHIGPRDTLARMRGAAFIALLVSEYDEHHLHFIARAMMSSVCVPLAVGGHAIAVTLSLGIAVSGEGAHALSILRQAADEAMYQAKRNGGGQLVTAYSADYAN